MSGSTRKMRAAGMPPDRSRCRPLRHARYKMPYPSDIRLATPRPRFRVAPGDDPDAPVSYWPDRLLAVLCECGCGWEVR